MCVVCALLTGYFLCTLMELGGRDAAAASAAVESRQAVNIEYCAELGVVLTASL